MCKRNSLIDAIVMTLCMSLLIVQGCATARGGCPYCGYPSGLVTEGDTTTCARCGARYAVDIFGGVHPKTGPTNATQATPVGNSNPTSGTSMNSSDEPKTVTFTREQIIDLKKRGAIAQRVSCPLCGDPEKTDVSFGEGKLICSSCQAYAFMCPQCLEVTVAKIEGLTPNDVAKPCPVQCASCGETAIWLYSGKKTFSLRPRVLDE